MATARLSPQLARSPASPAPPSPSTFGLASQLRSPTLSADGTSSLEPTSTGSPKKVTPAMRDERQAGSPRLSTAQWKAPSGTAPLRPARPPTTGSKGAGGLAQVNSFGRQGAGTGLVVRDVLLVEEEAEAEPFAGRKAFSSHGRTKSIPAHPTQAPPSSHGHHRSSSGSAPHRPPRPVTPPLPAGAAELSHKYPAPVATTNGDSIEPYASPDISFLPMRPLDLGIKFDPAPYSTYNANANVTGPNGFDAAKPLLDPRRSNGVFKPKEEEEEYDTHVTMAIAQRGQRNNSFRKASLGPLLTPSSGPGSAYWVPPLPTERKLSVASTAGSSHSAHSGGATLRIQPAGGRQIGQGLRSSFSGQLAAPVNVGGRRASSVYVPNSGPLPGQVQPQAQAGLTHAGLGGSGEASSALLANPNPSARLPLGLLSLARRTAHIAQVPGYGWRLNLLEKLETLTGTFLAIQEAEAILLIGNGPEKKAAANRRQESRKSLIGMPVSTPKPKPAPKPVPANKKDEPRGFFAKMKRSLTNEDKRRHLTDKPKEPAAKVVFGQPLGAIAEYGFVTSMIAGQRHELPGVCFSTVEEIYRRGQGMKVPGLMHLAGEATRVATLVKIFDSAPDYGEHHDLSIESIHNVTSLLKKYLRDLPEPILDQRLWRLYLSACVDGAIPLRARVACAQIILRLLPTPNFSLLVYLVAFLSQMPLFPENRLTLDSVSAIFGPAAMSPRPAVAPTAAGAGNRLHKFAGSMVITGPTDSVEATGANAKKAQDGLLWLLTHWSAVADGLLEADFDVNVEEAMEKAPSGPAGSRVGHMSFAGVHVEPASAANTIEIQAQPTFDRAADSPGPGSSGHGHGHGHARGSSRSPSRQLHRATTPASLTSPQASTRPSPAMSQTDSMRSIGSPASPSSRSSPAVIGKASVSPAGSPYQLHHEGVPAMAGGPRDTLGAPRMLVPPRALSPALERVRAEEPAAGTLTSPSSVYSPSDEDESDAPLRPDTPSAQLEPPSAAGNGPSDRSSSSTADSSALVRTPSLPKERSHAPLLRAHSHKAGGGGEQDEFGPLGGPIPAGGESVLDDMLDFDNDSSTLYNFPAPPTGPPARSLPPTPTRSDTSHASSAPGPPPKPAHALAHTILGAPFAAPVLASPNPDPASLVRSNGEQLREAQRLVDTQRDEIQVLWSQLTELESERSAEHAEIDALRREVEQLRQDRVEADNHKQFGAQPDSPGLADRAAEADKWEQMYQASQRQLEASQAELAQVHDDVEQAREESARDKKDAQAQIESLTHQLDGIRSLLGGRL